MVHPDSVSASTTAAAVTPKPPRLRQQHHRQQRHQRAQRERRRAGQRRAGWPVGVLINGASDIQRAKLLAAKILDHVNAVCVSEETGARKPDPQAFRTAAARCGFKLPADAWMGGDNPVTDIAGAMRFPRGAEGCRTWPDGP
ncbi:HAD family hydrolase [Kitasatospora sp. NPDC001539]|uniref:HAD family hydrolase n=1 Tax=Kitasatospora sp. NPDC001539 TaxID=3154384 RepID=UPI00332A58CE